MKPAIELKRTSMGFRPLQEFPELWGKENPCLQMVKGLGVEG